MDIILLFCFVFLNMPFAFSSLELFIVYNTHRAAGLNLSSAICEYSTDAVIYLWGHVGRRSLVFQ